MFSTNLLDLRILLALVKPVQIFQEKKITLLASKVQNGKIDNVRK